MLHRAECRDVAKGKCAGCVACYNMWGGTEACVCVSSLILRRGRQVAPETSPCFVSTNSLRRMRKRAQTVVKDNWLPRDISMRTKGMALPVKGSNGVLEPTRGRSHNKASAAVAASVPAAAAGGAPDAAGEDTESSNSKPTAIDDKPVDVAAGSSGSHGELGSGMKEREQLQVGAVAGASASLIPPSSESAVNSVGLDGGTDTDFAAAAGTSDLPAGTSELPAPGIPADSSAPQHSPAPPPCHASDTAAPLSSSICTPSGTPLEAKLPAPPPSEAAVPVPEGEAAAPTAEEDKDANKEAPSAAETA